MKLYERTDEIKHFKKDRKNLERDDESAKITLN